MKAGGGGAADDRVVLPTRCGIGSEGSSSGDDQVPGSDMNCGIQLAVAAATAVFSLGQSCSLVNKSEAVSCKCSWIRLEKWHRKLIGGPLPSKPEPHRSHVSLDLSRKDWNRDQN